MPDLTPITPRELTEFALHLCDVPPNKYVLVPPDFAHYLDLTSVPEPIHATAAELCAAALFKLHNCGEIPRTPGVTYA